MSEFPERQPVPMPCPACEKTELYIEMRKEFAPAYLAGEQIKMQVIPWPYLVCGNCGEEAKGQRG